MQYTNINPTTPQKTYPNPHPIIITHLTPHPNPQSNHTIPSITTETRTTHPQNKTQPNPQHQTTSSIQQKSHIQHPQQQLTPTNQNQKPTHTHTASHNTSRPQKPNTTSYATPLQQLTRTLHCHQQHTNQSKKPLQKKPTPHIKTSPTP